MIRRVGAESPLLRSVAGHPYLAANIGGRAACPQPEQDFWVAEQEGAFGFLCRMGETLYACGSLPQPELVEFALAVGFCRLITDAALPLKPDRPLLAMEYGGKPPRRDGHPVVRLYDGAATQFSSVAFARLQRQSRALATEEEVQRYAVSLSREIRGGGAVALCIEQDGQLVAGGALSHLYRHTVVLGGVAVLPQYRRQGLGSAIATAACHAALRAGQAPLLCCHPALEPLYQRAGFVAAPPLYCYQPKLEKE